ncbi:MAG: hypothetical protein SP1CHLAM54_00120 [Chlamydiia bacterium]|nr:hypothetical protein [Chlamydiia bacterium]MCH9614938.1 hypothetical protein [Chlamydiia bacterium]MCH9629886.1 hypothetical protein [Chlamydiia bacterium]
MTPPESSFACSLIIALLVKRTVEEEDESKFVELLNAIPTDLQGNIFVELEKTPEGLAKIQRHFKHFKCGGNEWRYSKAKRWLLQDSEAALNLPNFGLTERERYRLYHEMRQESRRGWVFSSEKVLPYFRISHSDRLFEIVKDGYFKDFDEVLRQSGNTSSKLRMRLICYLTEKKQMGAVANLVDTYPGSAKTKKRLTWELIAKDPLNNFERLFDERGGLIFSEKRLYIALRNLVRELHTRSISNVHMRAKKMIRLLEMVPKTYQADAIEYALQQLTYRMKKMPPKESLQTKHAFDFLKICLKFEDLSTALRRVRSADLTISRTAMRYLYRWRNLPPKLLQEVVSHSLVALRGSGIYLMQLTRQEWERTEAFNIAIPFAFEQFPERAPMMRYFFNEIEPRLAGLDEGKRAKCLRCFETLMTFRRNEGVVCYYLLTNLAEVLGFAPGLIPDLERFKAFLVDLYGPLNEAALEVIRVHLGRQEATSKEILSLIESGMRERKDLDPFVFTQVVPAVVNLRNTSIQRACRYNLFTIFRDQEKERAFLRLCSPGGIPLTRLVPVMLLANLSSKEEEPVGGALRLLGEHVRTHKSMYKDRSRGVTQAMQLFLMTVGQGADAKAQFLMRHLPLAFVEDVEELKMKVAFLTCVAHLNLYNESLKEATLSIEEIKERVVKSLREKIQLFTINEEEFLHRYQDVFATGRLQGLFEMYVSRFHTKYELRKVMREFYQRVMFGDFKVWRYKKTQSPHLAKLHAKHSAFLEAWKSDSAPERIDIGGKAYDVVNSGEAIDLLKAAGVGDTCLRIDGGENADCLMAYTNDGKYRIFAIKDPETGEVVARQMARVLFDKNGNPVIHISRYYGASSPVMVQALLEKAKKVAADLETKVYVYHKPSEDDSGVLLKSLGSPVPFEYVDGIGRTNGCYTISGREIM